MVQQQQAQQQAQQQQLLASLRDLSCELRELTGSSVEVLDAAELDACTFLRRFVATNTPVLIRGAVAHWPALHKWSPAQLVQLAGAQTISVDTTPNGLGDAVTPLPARDGGHAGAQQCFCIPHSRRMSFAEFVQLFFDSKAAAAAAAAAGGSSPPAAAEVPYLQQQNSNLTQELPELLQDVEPQLGFAAAAFGEAPEAVNLWIGDERASTTFHKDHYENLYCVVSGTKVFHLLPPNELWRMSLDFYPAARFQPSPSGALEPVLQQPPSSVLWCPIHPEPADVSAAAARHPLFYDPALPPPLRVEVGPGDALFLPAMWWHFVEQRACPEHGWCIAVNYWYEMAFDARFATFKLVESLARQAGVLPLPPPGAGDSAEGGQATASSSEAE